MMSKYEGKIPMIRCSVGGLLLLILAMLLVTPRAAHAAENYDNCTGVITSLPAVISTPGIWCLKQDLSTSITSGNAIEIQADDVTLDCNYFKVDGRTAGLGTATNGIRASNYTHVTVRHCDVRGFVIGLWFDFLTSSTCGHVVEDNRFDGNTAAGIVLNGDGSVLRRNRILNTGGSTLEGTWFVAILTNYSVEILDNTISGVGPTNGNVGDSYGISIGNGDSTMIGNRLSGLRHNGPYRLTRAIESSNESRITIRNNSLIGDGSEKSWGIFCARAQNLAKDNMINGFVTPIEGCTDIGGNAVVP